GCFRWPRHPRLHGTEWKRIREAGTARTIESLRATKTPRNRGSIARVGAPCARVGDTRNFDAKHPGRDLRPGRLRASTLTAAAEAAGAAIAQVFLAVRTGGGRH